MTPLQPGPLSPGMVSLLTAGRSVLWHTKRGIVVAWTEPEGQPDGVGFNLNGSYYIERFSMFTYIGERSDDGWITAPPGGWAECPVPGRMVEVRYFGGREVVTNSDVQDWTWLHETGNDDDDIIAFRLVEEAGTGGVTGSSAIEADTHRAAVGAVLGLHQDTADLVDRFAAALKEKLAKAERKYGYSDGWRDPNWRVDLIDKLAEHVGKGDPRDVAAYCAFAWHHGWSTAEAANGRGITPGQLLHELRRHFFNGEGWADYPEWADYDEAGHAEWERFAAVIGADLKRAVGEPDSTVLELIAAARAKEAGE